jgi:hypothetical protein
MIDLQYVKSDTSPTSTRSVHDVSSAKEWRSNNHSFGIAMSARTISVTFSVEDFDLRHPFDRISLAKH